MPASELDSQWFHNNPDREFRLRRQTPAEFAAWAIPPKPEWTAWCIIRKEDGAVAPFGLRVGDTWGDCDEELAPLFEDVGAVAA
ncbi:UNVERIFIED_ORG: hypothetical protein J2W74_005215 [Methylorubrum zatmanii]